MTVPPPATIHLVPIEDLRAELRGIDRDLCAAQPMGWGNIAYELDIAIRTLSLIAFSPTDVSPMDGAAGPIGPEALCQRLYVVRDQLERHIADAGRHRNELPLAMAANATGCALVRVLREVAGFKRMGDEIIASIQAEAA